MTNRRIALIGDRIEGVCATHKIPGRVKQRVQLGTRVMFMLDMMPEHDLRPLASEIELCLGRPVVVHRDSVVCDVQP